MQIIIPLPQIYLLQTLWVAPAICVLASSSCNSEACSSLKTTALKISKHLIPNCHLLQSVWTRVLSEEGHSISKEDTCSPVVINRNKMIISIDYYLAKQCSLMCTNKGKAVEKHLTVPRRIIIGITLKERKLTRTHFADVHISNHSDGSNYGQKSCFSSKETVSVPTTCYVDLFQFEELMMERFLPFFSSQRRDEIHLSLGYKRIRELSIWGLGSFDSVKFVTFGKKKISFLSCVSHPTSTLPSPWLLLGLPDLWQAETPPPGPDRRRAGGGALPP